MLTDLTNINQTSSTPEWSETHAELARIIKQNDQRNFNKAEQLIKEINPNGSHPYGGVLSYNQALN